MLALILALAMVLSLAACGSSSSSDTTTDDTEATAALAVGGIVGLVNGFFVAKFQLHPFIVTLATQLIVYGVCLMYYMANGNNGQSISGLSDPTRTVSPAASSAT